MVIGMGMVIGKKWVDGRYLNFMLHPFDDKFEEIPKTLGIMMNYFSPGPPL